ncbi:MAG: tripartite tricarboxylate transporter TctB family protein [Thermodesulfobacteriota bacterium]
MKRANRFISIILIVFTGSYAYFITRLPVRNLPHTLGGDFMPWLLTVCLLFLSISLLLKSLFYKSEEERIATTSLKEVMGVLSLLAIIIAYIEVMIYFGYVLITPFFIAAMMLMSGSRRPMEIIIFSVGISLAVYVLFYRFFHVPLPAGRIY